MTAPSSEHPMTDTATKAAKALEEAALRFGDELSAIPAVSAGGPVDLSKAKAATDAVLTAAKEYRNARRGAK